MKQCLALAALACLFASGCAASGLNRGGEPGHVYTSRNAPRPGITRDYRKPGPEPAVQLAAFNDASCGCDEGCGCAVDGSGCCGDGCDPYGCNSGCRRLIDGLASGFCGCGHKGPMYPEYPAFNQGPPVGQVGYPYYTVHGPRDFLRDNPPSIGPY
jgi:hypothetical protein